MAEHVFFPDEPPRPLRIKYNGSLYDGGNWDQFPVRHGWKLETGAESSLDAESHRASTLE